MRQLYLIGMPGSGKTTLGKRLAAALELPFRDLDARIEQREGKSIPALFEGGEDCFRDAETRALKEAAALPPTVIATGGGIIVREENAHIMRQSGTVIFLDADPERIIARADLSDRPLIGADAQRLHALYAARIDRYRACADVTVENNGGSDEAFERLLAVVQKMIQ